MKYELLDTSTPLNPDLKTVKRFNEDGSFSFIPTDPSNSDYQTYLKYISEQENQV